jgi:hypothetical protein
MRGEMKRFPVMLLAFGALACGGGGSASDNTKTTQPPASAPAILLSSASASFSVTAGAASPAAQSATVTNGGTGTLSGLAAGTIVYTAGPATGWLTANLSGSTAPATLTLTPSTGTLAAGSYTATVPITASVTGVTNSPQNVTIALVVLAGPATKLAFVGQPVSNTGNVTPSPTVAIEDALGDVVTTATTAVTIALGTNTAGAALTGTTTVNAVAGLAVFNGLTVTKIGTGYTLVASATGLTGATSAAFNVSSAVAATTMSTAGQSLAFLTTPNFSTTLAVQAGSQYLIEVVNTSSSFTLTEGFSLGGNFAATSAAQAQQLFANRAPVFTPRATATNAQQGSSRADYSLPGSPVTMATMRGMAQNHMAMLDANRRIMQNSGSPRAAWAAARAAVNRNTGSSASVASTTIGVVNKVFVRNSLSATCSAVDSIGARTVAVGQHVVVLADTNLTKWPQAFRPDTSFYQIFANEYDAVTWPHLLANIGNPLAFDNTLSGANKVTVVITPTLNNLAGLAGGGTVVAFVSSCDFFPNKSAAIGNGFSNQTEAFYSFVPSANGYSVSTWELQIRATAAHETKHIVSLGNRINVNAPAFEEVWLEEGLAQTSSEIWERFFNQAVWKGNANFIQTVGCELNFSNVPCNATGGKPFAMVLSHFPFFFEYLQSESTSNSEGLGIDTPSNYGAGWAFSRWIVDQYATTEGPFIQSLIAEPALTGLNNLAAHTGQSIPTLLVYFNLASAIFQGQTFTAADVRTTIPSFNFANIDSIGQNGLTCSGVKCGIFTANGAPTPIFPVSPIALTASAGTFSRIVNTVPGTSASYFLLSSPIAGIETLQLLTPGGIALSGSSALRVAILRVQ